ncbi:MAG: alpha/beta fold hydrolase, partial [Thiomonas sp.]
AFVAGDAAAVDKPPSASNTKKLTLPALGQSLLALAQRGTGVMVFSAGTDFSAVNYAGQLRESLGLAQTEHDRLLFTHLPDIDHAVTTRVAQQQWIDTVHRGLLRLAPTAQEPTS